MKEYNSQNLDNGSWGRKYQTAKIEFTQWAPTFCKPNKKFSSDIACYINISIRPDGPHCSTSLTLRGWPQTA